MLGYAAVVMLVERDGRGGVTIAAASLAALGIALGWGLPHFRGEDTTYAFLHRWSAWGPSAGEILLGMATRPHEVAAALFSKEHVLAFAGLLFVPFLDPRRIPLFLAPWALNATSGFAQQAQLSLYYGTPLLAFAALAAVRSVNGPRAKLWLGGRAAPVAAATAVALNVSHLAFPVIPRERAEFLDGVRAIPDGVPVQAMSCFFPVLEYERPKSRIVSGTELVEEYALIRTDETTWPLSGGEAKALVDAALGRARYDVELARGDFFILKRRASPAEGTAADEAAPISTAADAALAEPSAGDAPPRFAHRLGSRSIAASSALTPTIAK
jgi:hypothetical protein